MPPIARPSSPASRSCAGATPAPFLLLVLLSFASLGVGPCAPQSIGELGDAAVDGPAPAPDRSRDDAAPRPDQAPGTTPPGPLPGTPADAGGPNMPAPPIAGTVLCAERSTEELCAAAMAQCRWLSPGCGDQTIALPKAGCYDRNELNCGNDAACAPGKRCTTQNVDPCGPPKPGFASCAACGMHMNICL